VFRKYRGLAPKSNPNQHLNPSPATQPVFMTNLSHKTDLHVFHFRASLPLGGDLDAAFTPREIVDWVRRFKVFDRFVLGNHPPNFFRIRTKLQPEEYLDAMASMVSRLRDSYERSRPSSEALGAAGGRMRIFSGLECDFLLSAPGKVGFNPGERLLSRYDPDVSLIAFHFHNTLTYGKRYEVDIADLVNAFKWAIASGMFSVFAHPFDVLGRIYREDRRGFEEIANLAREGGVAFEINADKGFDKESVAALIKNGNLFSFGGDFHALSYWLKHDPVGIGAEGEDRVLVGRVLGLTREAASKEKRYWAELDPLFWQLPCSGERRRALRNYATYLCRRLGLSDEAFTRGLRKVAVEFGPHERLVLERRLRELRRIYVKWGGAPTKKERMYVEKKYLLRVPLTSAEVRVYEQWLARAFKLGLGKAQLINSWDTPKLEAFLHR